MSQPVIVAPPEESVRMEPQDALRQLIESEGFRIFLDHVRSEWGAAALNRKTRAVFDETNDPAQHSAMIQALHGTAESIKAIFAWPEEEYERLRVRSASPKEPGDRFEHLRRTS